MVMRKAISIAIVLILLLGLPARLVEADSVKNISVIQNIAIPGDDFIGSISLAEANMYEDDYNSKYLFPIQGICTAGTGKIAVIDNSYGRVHILDGLLHNVLTFGSLSTLIYPTDIDYKEGIFYISDALGGKVQFFSGNGAFIKTLDAGFLNTPTGVTASKGYLFVSDYFENTIYKLDMSGNIKKTVNIDYPGGLTSDADGNIYAVSMSGKNVYKFDADLNILLVVIGEELLFPSDVAIGTGGNIFVLDRGLSRGGAINGRIVQYSASGKYIKKIGKTAESYPSQQDGALLTPAGIAADMLGNIYVMDAGYYYWDINSDAPFGHSIGSRLSVFSETGIFLSKKESPKDLDGRLVNPIDATLDENGNIWVVNYGGFATSELVQFSPAGSLVRRIDTLKGGAFPSAYSIVSDKAGNIFVGLYGGIAIYGSNGSVKNVLYDDRLGQVKRIIQGIDDYFYATLFDKNSVVKFDYLGNIIQIYPVCKFPSGITQDKDGNFYITSIYDNKIHCFNNAFIEQRTIGEGGGRGTMQLYIPEDVATDKAGNLVVADTENGRISVFYEITSIEVENGTFLVTDCFHNIIRVLFEDISSVPYDVHFSVYPEAVTARPGEKINITMSVMNVGSNGDGYNILVTEVPKDWNISVASDSFFLDQQRTGIVQTSHWNWYLPII
jgi:sugar lactone lactonase YvrE